VPAVQDRTEMAFLHDICSNPADDSVRLIYADWLDDRGLPGDAKRARFIRVQIGIAKMCQVPAAPLTDFRLLGRHQRLISAVDEGDYEFLVPDWTGTSPEDWSCYADGSQIIVACGYSSTHYPFTLHWRRGFVEAISLSLVDFQKDNLAATIFASHPVQHVTLMGREPMCHAAVNPWLFATTSGPPGESLWAWGLYLLSGLSAVERAYHLPSSLFYRLEGYVDKLLGLCFYRTQKQAQDALAQACVLWALNEVAA
jgi:uncharacterized protein (TIGR02996 family)